ncbi:MAG: competence/damage-inducible protein A [Deltaproteobacteria bacterium]|nr:competence/damage-inducible protein A [Deltaproteobacteria bacterium]
MPKKPAPIGFGLIIIGSEILDGRIQDKHFENTQRLVRERNHTLRYSMILVDDPALILDKLKWAMKRPEPFFCCGGIGATPDDYTRQCAAKAVGVSLEFHKEGIEILENRPGFEMTPSRMKMVEFPKGSVLVPNPVNQIPGFSIANGYFIPGFPSMAEPMTAWIMDTYFEAGKATVSRTLILPGAKEADLVPIMEDFTRTHPKVSFSSLPRFVAGGTEVHLGLSGLPDDFEEGLRDLVESLESQGLKWVEKT